MELELYLGHISVKAALFGSRFRRVEAKTKCDRDRLNAALSATWTVEIPWYYFP